MEIIAYDPTSIEDVIATSSWLQTYATHIKHIDDKVIEISHSDLQSISTLTTTSDVMLVVHKPANSVTVDFRESRSIFLDDIQDPGNVGSIIRTANWFGYKNVIRSHGSADFYGTKSLRAGMGSHLSVSLETMNCQELAEAVSESAPILAADMEGHSIYEVDPPSSHVLIIGNEGNGLSDVARQIATSFISVPPSPASKNNESLNAAMACSILAAFLCR